MVLLTQISRQFLRDFRKKFLTVHFLPTRVEHQDSKCTMILFVTKIMSTVYLLTGGRVLHLRRAHVTRHVRLRVTGLAVHPRGGRGSPRAGGAGGPSRQGLLSKLEGPTIKLSQVYDSNRTHARVGFESYCCNSTF